MFPDPQKVNPNRPVGKYIHYGWGTHTCFGAQIANIGLTAMLRCFARLPNLRRASGPEGQLKYVNIGLFKVFMAADWSNYSYCPAGPLFLKMADLKHSNCISMNKYLGSIQPCVYSFNTRFLK